MSDFFDDQSDLTAAKIKFYEEYIQGYLPKILHTFKHCLIADLFCGAGKNGDKDGSPLVLIRKTEYLLTNPELKKNNPKIEILFNDKDKANIDNLKAQLNITPHPSIQIHPIINIEFQKLLPEIIQEFTNNKIPKLFFLDPFKYSDVTINNLKDLMALPSSEVFLFIPVFHIYRFSNEQSYKKGHKARQFIEEFTTRGITKYNDIDDFMKSIKEKIKSELNLHYV